MPAPAHVSLIAKSATVRTTDGQPIEVWDIDVDGVEPHISAWAAHFRQQYCSDAEIDQLRDGTGLSRADYLARLVFPDERQKPGPSIRAGDFAELLLSDFVEHLLGCWVPRGKYAEKAVRNESVKGVDVVGFQTSQQEPPSVDDLMITVEVKAQLSPGAYTDRLQVAVNDSSKDPIRQGETLNAIKRRLYAKGDKSGALTVRRFQSPSDRPYTYKPIAAAVLVDSVFDEPLLAKTSVSKHENPTNLLLIVFRGRALMNLVHSLYRTACDEA